MTDKSVEDEAVAGPWQVRVVLVQDGSEWVVSEATIRPAGPLPPGGLTTRALREIPFGRAAAEVMAKQATQELQQTPKARRGLQGGDDTVSRYLRAAHRYLLYVQAGHPSPAQAVADEQGVAKRTVYNQLLHLRDIGLLEKPGHGRAGGRFTPKGRRMLIEMGE